MIFDVRTAAGWDTVHRKVSVVATDYYQRIGITTRNTQDKINLDRFIRVQQPNQTWGEWHREQMQERMWTWQEVRDVVQGLDCKLEGVYGDDFALLEGDDEPGLAYFVVGKPRSKPKL